MPVVKTETINLRHCGLGDYVRKIRFASKGNQFATALPPEIRAVLGMDEVKGSTMEEVRSAFDASVETYKGAAAPTKTRLIHVQGFERQSSVFRSERAVHDVGLQVQVIYLEQIVYGRAQPLYCIAEGDSKGDPYTFWRDADNVAILPDTKANRKLVLGWVNELTSLGIAVRKGVRAHQIRVRDSRG